MTTDQTPAVAFVVPMLNEAPRLARLRAVIDGLDPAPAETLLVDGGSADGSVEAAQALGFRVVASPARRRGAQINAGVAVAESDYVCVLHADSEAPHDAVRLIRRTLAAREVSLGGFTAVLSGPEKVRWLTSFHNWIKTWYAPLLFRPLTFFRGGRLLFGDHAMFFRREDFLAVGGCDASLKVMEDADLCIRFSRIGRARLLPRIALTSDRRVAKWGGLRANATFVLVGVLWGLGFKRRVAPLYPDIREEAFAAPAQRSASKAVSG